MPTVGGSVLQTRQFLLNLWNPDLLSRRLHAVNLLECLLESSARLGVLLQRLLRVSQSHQSLQGIRRKSNRGLGLGKSLIGLMLLEKIFGDDGAIQRCDVRNVERTVVDKDAIFDHSRRLEL